MDLPLPKSCSLLLVSYPILILFTALLLRGKLLRFLEATCVHAPWPVTEWTSGKRILMG